jgi:hypothetical protein
MPPIATYSLTRTFGDDDSPYASHTFSTSDVDAINAAHMIAAGFNTISRNFLLGWVLAVVNTADGKVYYDGKAQQIAELDPRRGQRAESGPNDGYTTPQRASKYAHLSRDVLESSYAELELVRSILEEAGVETIPPSEGVAELRAQINGHRKRESQNRSARAEMISFVKRAHAKKVKLQAAVPDCDGRPELDDRWRGMLDVLAKFLVVTGEADADEGHAAARRLCGIED